MQFEDKEQKKSQFFTEQRVQEVEQLDEESEKSGQDDLVDDIFNNLYQLINAEENSRGNRIAHLRSKSRFHRSNLRKDEKSFNEQQSDLMSVNSYRSMRSNSSYAFSSAHSLKNRQLFKSNPDTPDTNLKVPLQNPSLFKTQHQQRALSKVKIEPKSTWEPNEEGL